MIFQDPFSSLNPRMTIAEIIGEPLLVNGIGDARTRNARVAELLDLVHLPSAYLNRFPHAFSGGQRQRIGIARALALNPVADRGRRAGVGAGRFGAGADRQPDAGAAGPAGHRLSVRRARPVGGEACQPPRRGDVCRQDRRDRAHHRRCSTAPRHPYTEALLSAVPVPDPRRRAQRIVLEGDVADPSDPPPGCAFHPRCRYATRAVPPGDAGAGGGGTGALGAVPQGPGAGIAGRAPRLTTSSAKSGT